MLEHIVFFCPAQFNVTSYCLYFVLLSLSKWMMMTMMIFRNPGLAIQNLLSDSRSEVRFRHYRCFRVAFSDKLYALSGADKHNHAARHAEKP